MRDNTTSISNFEPESDRLRGVDSPEPDSAANTEAPSVLVATSGSAGESADQSISAHLLVRGTEPFMRPTGPYSPLETILGPDERVRILDTESAPWRMICSLRIRGTRDYIGTGWFAGPRTIITAGHCVYNPNMGGWAKEVFVVPARDGQRKPFGELRSHRFSATNRWLSSQEADFDYAAIHLDDEALPITAKTGWFSTVVLNDAALSAQRINVSGYPRDKGIAGLQGSEQWFHAKQIVYSTARRIYYDVSTINGQSGAPAWLDTKDGPKVVGIHAYGVGGTQVLGLEANSAPRITAEVLEVLKGWIRRA